jgi:predicted ArsR family transcriptional regulator
MLLADIRSYLKERGAVLLEDVAIHFDITADAAQFALEYWIKKGKVYQQSASCGSSCGGCGAGDSYQWQDADSVMVLNFMPYQ